MLDFVMKVDLSYFFADARRNSLVLVDNTWTKVKELEIHIENLFKFSKISLMTEDGYYLPPLESIKVIKSALCVKAFKLEELNNLNINNCQTYEGSSIQTKKKRKNRSDEAEIFYSTPNFSKASKRKNIHLATINGSAKKRAKRHKSQCQVEDFEKELTMIKDLAENNLPDTPQCSPPSPTWRSQSRQPQKTLQVADEGVSACEESVNKNKESITLQVANQGASDTEESINRNMEATIPQADTTVVGANDQKVNQVEFYCALMSVESSVVRTFKLPRKSEAIKILEDIRIPAPAAQNGESKQDESLDDNNKLQFEDSNQLKNVSTTSEAATQVTEHKLVESDAENEVVLLDADDSDLEVMELPKKLEAPESIIGMLRNAVVLDNLPQMRDTVVCKIPKYKNSTELYPCTDYIAGICTYINRRTRLITMEIIACSTSSKQILSQYVSNLDSSQNSTLIITVNFKDLVEAKVVLSN